MALSKIWGERPGRREHETQEMIAALVLGVSLGLAAFFGGPLLVLAGLAAILGIVLAFTRPEWLILLFLAMVAQVIPGRFNPYLRLGGRGLYPTDLILLLLIGVIFVRLIAERGYRVPRSPLNLPMLWFLGAVIIGVLTAVRTQGISFSVTTFEARFLLYYSIFFVVTGLIRTKAQLTWLVKGLLVVGALAALGMIVQTILGRSVLDQNVLTVNETTGSGLSVARIYLPGTTGAYAAFMVSLCLLALPGMARFRPLGIFLLLITGGALLVSLNRNLILSSALGLVVLLFVIRRQGWSTLATNAVLACGVALLAIALLAVGPSGERLVAYVSVFISRLSSLSSGQALSPSDTLLWRLNEYHFAVPIILSHPIFGIGAGTPYRPPFYPGDNLESFIHNAYAWLLLKTGLLGLTAYLVIGLIFVVRGVSKWQQVEPGLLRATSLGFALAFLGMAASNFVAPYLVQDWSLALIGVTFGLNEVTYALATQEGR